MFHPGAKCCTLIVPGSLLQHELFRRCLQAKQAIIILERMTGALKMQDAKLQDMKMQAMKIQAMKIQDMKMQDMKMTDQVAGHEIATKTK